MVLSVSAGDDFTYYLQAAADGVVRENYYTGAAVSGEPAGIWQGRGAAAVGLTGEVSAAQMDALYGRRIDPRDERFNDPGRWAEAARIGGRPRKYLTVQEAYERALNAEPDASPERRERLRLDAERSARRNVQYIDVTFSVQKSVSVLHLAFERARVEAERAGDAEVAAGWAAYRDAVVAAVWAGNNAALAYLQEHAGYSRVGHHGGAAGRWVDGHDWIVASFLQHDSRAGDPQLHVHNPILNLAECGDGTWRTLDSQAIKRCLPAASTIASRTTEEVLAQATGVRFVTRPDGKSREVVGIPAEVLDLTSGRRREITPGVAGLVEAFEQRVGRPPNARELYWLAQDVTLHTRKSKNSRPVETLAERADRINASTRTEVNVSLAQLAEWGRSQPLGEREPARFSEAAVIDTALADVQARKSVWNEEDLVRSVSDALPDMLGVDPADIGPLLVGIRDRALTRPEVVQVGGEREEDRPVTSARLLANGASAYGSPAGRSYALRDHLAAEHALRQAATDRGARATDKAAAEAAAARLAAEGLVLGADQRQALVGILTSGAKVETLVGPAGTGKSTVVGGLARVWADPDTWTGGQAGGEPAKPGGPAGRVVGLAASQQATEVLAAEGVPARNVTRWLATQDRLAAGAPAGDDTEWRLTARDLVVVDEAAMLPTADLVAIQQRVAAAAARLLLTGDHRQMAAVGAGGGMRMLAAAGGHELVDVRRFAGGWEGPASLRLRDRDDSVLHTYRRHGRLIDAGTPEQARTSAARAWLADHLAGKHTVLIAGTNEDAHRLSAQVRAELVRLGRVEESGVRLGLDGNTAGVGDLVQARHNAWQLAGYHGNPKAPINRETYRVVETRDDGGLRVELVSGPHAGTRLTLPASYVDTHVSLGYAGTVNSIQGGTVDTAHVLAGPGTSPNALYVGMSRGREANHAHVITHPADEQQPAGAAHHAPRADPLGVLAGILAPAAGPAAVVEPDAAALEQQEAADQRRVSQQTAVERFADEAAEVYTARTAAALDRLAAVGRLSADQRLAFAAETTVTASLARLLRSAELAGHDPDQVLAEAIAGRDFTGARSLPQVVHGRIERRLAGRLDPRAGDYAGMVPATTDPDWHAQLARTAAAADARREQLADQAAADPPDWAKTAFGPPPDDSDRRAGWQQRAGAVAAWRELAGHHDQADPIGRPPPRGMPEHYAAWHAAWTALGRPEVTRTDAELSDGQLRVRVRAWEREKNWEPSYVGESLTATSLAALRARQHATLGHARAAVTTDPAEAEQIARHAAEQAALADLLEAEAGKLEQADHARARWLVHTAPTHDEADRARAELETRGLPVDAGEDPDAVTAEEWLTAYRADQAATDPHRPITAEHDLADHIHQRDLDLAAVDASDSTESPAAADVGELPATVGAAVPPDIRATRHQQIPDQPGRIATADDAQTALQHAQAVLAEIDQRRQLDQRRADEEQRSRELAYWSADDQTTAHTHHAEDVQADG